MNKKGSLLEEFHQSNYIQSFKS